MPAQPHAATWLAPAAKIIAGEHGRWGGAAGQAVQPFGTVSAGFPEAEIAAHCAQTMHRCADCPECAPSAMQGQQEEPQLPRAGGGGNAELNNSLASRRADQGSAVDQAGVGACHHDVPVAPVVCLEGQAISRLLHSCCCSRPGGASPACTRTQVTQDMEVPAATCWLRKTQSTAQTLGLTRPAIHD